MINFILGVMVGGGITLLLVVVLLDRSDGIDELWCGCYGAGMAHVAGSGGFSCERSGERLRAGEEK